MPFLDKLFNPRGIAIVGAQPDPTRGGGQPLRALQAYGYAGCIYPVHPKHTEMKGLRCYPSVAAIDGPCDVAVIAIPPKRAIEAVRECGAKGIPFVVMYSGAFRVPAEGCAGTLEDELRDAARTAGVRIVGPNCLGVVNVPGQVYASFGSMSREPQLREGCVSLVSQSGGFGYSMILRCHAAGAGFRYLVSSGNECDLTMPELLDACLDDPGTRVVVSYIEGVTDGRALMACGEKALRLGKPILLWKAGNSEEGKRAAASHTGNMTGSYDVYRAALRQAGIIEVSGFEEVTELVKVFSSGWERAGRRIGLMSASGGAAAVFADCAERLNLTLATPSTETAAAIRATGMDIGDSVNPMDCAPGFLNDTNAAKFAAALNILLADPEVDQLCMMLMTVLGRQAHNGALALADAVKRHGKPITVFSSVPRDNAAEAFDVLAAAGIPVLTSPPNVALGASRLAEFMEKRSRVAVATPAPPDKVLPALPTAPGTLTESDSKALLQAVGVTVSRDVIVPVDGRVPHIWADGPYVVKIVSADIPHKTEVGGVIIGVPDRDRLVEAIASMLSAVRAARPAAKIDGVMVSEMVMDGTETLIGVVNDPVFGPVVAFGLGGVLTEVLRDLSYRVAPFDRSTALEMISELRGRAIFDGVRGQPALDIDAAADALVAISHLAWQCRERIREIDVNPLIVRPRGKGAVAVDALVVVN